MGRTNYADMTNDEYIDHCGQNNPDQPWILSDMWYRNPYYLGPEVDCPEMPLDDADDDHDDDVDCDDGDDGYALASAGFGTDEDYGCFGGDDY